MDRSLVPAYGGLNHILFALYTEETRNGTFKMNIVNVREQIIYRHLSSSKDTEWKHVHTRRKTGFSEEKILGEEVTRPPSHGHPATSPGFAWGEGEAWPRDKIADSTSHERQQPETVNLHLRRAIPERCRIPGCGCPPWRCARPPEGQVAQRPLLSSSLSRRASALPSEGRQAWGAPSSFCFSCARQQCAGSI